MSVVIRKPARPEGAIDPGGAAGRQIMETRRLILRPWKRNKADAKELYRYAKDPRVGPAAGWNVHRDAAYSLRIIREVYSEPDLYAIVLKETGKPVGACGITYGTRGRRFLLPTEGELGYWVGVPYWGQGFAGEAAERLLRRCFTELGMTAVWCAHFEGNVQSARVLEKCGFLYDHTGETYVEALHERRKEHFAKLTRERWILQNRAADKETG